jgi:CHASE2 domain-containing sensor protein/tRNA A-37 threonylcarbamoyl transferase component Bud32
MSYCINPDCGDRCNLNNFNYCQRCGSSLIIHGRYRIIKPLRQLDGQHHTEVFEVKDGRIPKILKVLTSNRRRLVELFEQESKILAQLQHLPVAQLDGYFTIIPNNSDKKLRCLVMEKVEGENLKQWLKTHGKLTETLAIDWLKQLLSILAQVHQQHILHRDIKPSNIMIRPDGQLILIDFGTARKLTQTYIEKLEDADITRIYSPGYTAPEQLQGQAVYRSDFFALGRTFVHLMTGIYPDDLPKTTNKQLIWYEQAPQISSRLKKLIDRLIASSSSERPSELEILERLNSFRGSTLAHRYFALKNWQKNISLIFVISIAIAYLVIGIRSLGWLQPMELQAFDRLIHLRPSEKPDSRLLLITVDEADIQYQNQQNMSLRWSLADEALAQLLTKIKPYQPRTIGIDIYRDFTVDADFPNLARELRNSDRLFSLCKIPAPQDDVPSGTPPPPEVSLDRIGFSDFVADSGDLIRRQLLHIIPPTTSACTAEYAFNLQLALHYLSKEKIESSVTTTGEMQIGNTIFKPINSDSGGYQGIDAAGYQILLNYRSLKSPKEIAQKISLKEILSDRADNQLEDLIKDRIVIIGVTAASSADDWQTPYCDDTAGIFLQAQMVSQIISAVLDHRPLLWWWSTTWSTTWIIFWSLLGGIIGYYLYRPLCLGVAIAFSLLVLFLSCWAIFLQAGWIPLIPPMLAFLLASLATVLSKSYKF